MYNLKKKKKCCHVAICAVMFFSPNNSWKKTMERKWYEQVYSIETVYFTYDKYQGHMARNRIKLDPELKNSNWPIGKL